LASRRSRHGFHPDNILISSRKANTIALIDRSSANIVWRLGPYFEADPGAEHQRINSHGLPRPLDQISGQHNPHFIAERLPGAGNLLVFDNQGGAGYPPAPLGIYAGSRVLEIDPVTKHIVWQYTAEDSGRPPWTFFSSFVSNAQRLPNGNTLITEGMHGRIFQVTPSGQVVWEYLTPYEDYAVAGEPEVKVPTVEGVDRPTLTRMIYRSQAVPFEWVPVNGREGGW
jgi:Arylsulfotransferase (ASST)